MSMQLRECRLRGIVCDISMFNFFFKFKKRIFQFLIYLGTYKI